MAVDSHHLTERGRALAPIGPHRRPGGAAIHTGGCLGLLLVMILIIAYQWVHAFSLSWCGRDVDGVG
jgi:hypothetical protein